VHNKPEIYRFNFDLIKILPQIHFEILDLRIINTSCNFHSKVTTKRKTKT